MPPSLCVEIDDGGGGVIFTVHLLYRPREPILKSAHLICVIHPTTIDRFVVAIV